MQAASFDMPCQRAISPCACCVRCLRLTLAVLHVCAHRAQDRAKCGGGGQGNIGKCANLGGGWQARGHLWRAAARGGHVALARMHAGAMRAARVNAGVFGGWVCAWCRLAGGHRPGVRACVRVLHFVRRRVGMTMHARMLLLVRRGGVRM